MFRADPMDAIETADPTIWPSVIYITQALLPIHTRSRWTHHLLAACRTIVSVVTHTRTIFIAPPIIALALYRTVFPIFPVGTHTPIDVASIHTRLRIAWNRTPIPSPPTIAYTYPVVATYAIPKAAYAVFAI